MSQSIFRQQRESNFTYVPNELLHDPSLSWKAKGLLVFILSLPNDWELNTAHLKTKSTDGADAVYSGLKELCDARYMWKRARGGGGWEYLVWDTPHQENPFTEKPNRENPESGKSRTTKNLSEEQTTKEETKNVIGELELGISKPKKQGGIPDCLSRIEGFSSEWDNFKAHRKTIRKPMTPRAAELILEILSERPLEALAAVRTAIEKCWCGIRWDWIDNLTNPRFNGANGRKTSGIPEHSKWDFEIPNRKN